MAQPVNAATPLDTLTGPVPPLLEHVSTPPPGLVPMANVTALVLSAVSTLPLLSSTATEAEKVPVPVAGMLAPDAGWLVNTSLVVVPVVMLKLLALLVSLCAALFRAVSVYPVPLLVMAQPVKLATPFTTVTGPVPPVLEQVSTPL